MKAKGEKRKFYLLPLRLYTCFSGGKGGIRTHGTLLKFTAFPVLPVQPLLHLSENVKGEKRKIYADFPLTFLAIVTKIAINSLVSWRNDCSF